MRAPERAADGLLPAGDARARRAAPRGGGAPRGRQPERRALRRRMGSGADRAELHLVDREGRRRGDRGRARRERALSRHRRSRSPLAALVRRPRGTREGRRVRRLLEAAARPALGARPRLPRAVGAGDGGRDEAASARARADGRDACASRPHALGAHARGLSPHEHVHRDAPARRCSARTSPRERSRARSSTPSDTAGRSPSRG